MPDLPTVAEAGLPGFEAYNWNGIVVPGRTPRPVIFRPSDDDQRRIAT